MKAFFVLCTCFAGHALSAQSVHTNPVDTGFFGKPIDKNIRGTFRSLEVDAGGNIYLISTEGQLKKYSAEGDSLAAYNNVLKYGEPDAVDVNNPLRAIIKLKKYNTLVFADNKLATLGMLNLRKKGFYDVPATARSYDNNVWIYDNEKQELLKIDEAGNILLRSPDMRQSLGNIIRPQRIFDLNSSVLLYDSSRGFYFFDHYGAFKLSVVAPGWSSMQLVGNLVQGLKNGQLMSVDQQGKITSKHSISIPGMSHFRTSSYGPVLLINGIPAFYPVTDFNP